MLLRVPVATYLMESFIATTDLAKTAVIMGRLVNMLL